MNDEINELINNENESNDVQPIKGSDQYFIQQHYKSFTLEQLCSITQLSPEAVTNYIEEYENYLTNKGINTDRKFVFGMSINGQGTVTYSIEWPEINAVDEVLPYIGKFFYLLNEGKFKASMAQFLMRYAEERSAYKVIKTVMEDWNKQDTITKETPIIAANEVFGT